MSQHDTLTLRDALRNIQYEAASLADAQVIALQALNATYPARAALSAAQPAQAVQSEPLPEHADHVPEIAARLRLVARLAGCADAIPEDDRTAVGCIFSMLGNIRRALELKQAAQGETKRCEHCDDTGDVTSIDGHWRGYCTCPHGKAAQGAGEVVGEIDDAVTLNGCRAGCMNQNLPPGTKLYTQPAAGADVLDAVSPVGDWSYSHDEERFSGQFDTKEAAIAEGLSCGARFVGQVNHVRDIISDGQIGLDIYERIGEILGDEIGEVAECFTLSPDQQEVLGKVVLDWIESGPGFNCWGIKDSEPIDAAIAASGRQE